MVVAVVVVVVEVVVAAAVTVTGVAVTVAAEKEEEEEDEEEPRWSRELIRCKRRGRGGRGIFNSLSERRRLGEGQRALNTDKVSDDRRLRPVRNSGGGHRLLGSNRPCLSYETERAREHLTNLDCWCCWCCWCCWLLAAGCWLGLDHRERAAAWRGEFHGLFFFMWLYVRAYCTGAV